MPILTQGDVNRLTVTVVANGETPVAVAAPQVTAKSVVVLSRIANGGTPNPSAPNVLLNPGVGFSITSAASDTSTYNAVVL